VPQPLVTIECALGSVSDTCWSGAIASWRPSASSFFIWAPHRRELFLEVLNPLLRHMRRIPVRRIKVGEVTGDARIELLLTGLELVCGSG